jgi:hypothetical protein
MPGVLRHLRRLHAKDALRLFAVGIILRIRILQAADEYASQDLTQEPPVAVTAWHCDAGHTGQNLSEHILNCSNVNPRDFGKLFTQPIDGFAYAQPLYVPNVKIDVPGGDNNGIHNVLFVATEHDSVYAFDADMSRGKNSRPLWKVSFINPVQNIGPIPFLDQGSEDLVPEIGITGTPVIDLSSGTLFVVSRTKEIRKESGSQTTHYVQTLHALDIVSGAEKCGGPVVLGDTTFCQAGKVQVQKSASMLQFPGVGCAGDTIVDGRVVFNAFTQNQRPALVLSKGVFYVAWASHSDHLPVHGWIAGFDAIHLSLESVLNLSPDGSLATIWMSGAGPAIDSHGNLYVATGNGIFDANIGGRDYGESIVKLSPFPSAKHPWQRLVVADYFTPFEFDDLNARDLDLGSGGPMLLPDQPGPHPHELVEAVKQGTVYVVDRDRLGRIAHPGVGPDDSVQTIPPSTLLARSGGIPSSINSPAYWNGYVYYSGRQRPLLQIPITSGLLASSPEHHGDTEFNFPFPTPQISANGRANAIAWVQDFGTTGVVYAYDASDVSRELWNSHQSGKRDEYGASVKFAMPIIANGKVYVAGQTAVAAFGLLDHKSGPIGVPTQLLAQRVSFREVDLTWTGGAGQEDGFKIDRSRNGGSFILIGGTESGVTCFHDMHLDPDSQFAYRVYAYNSTDDSATTETVQVAARKVPLTEGLLGWWSFDEGIGNSTADSSGAANQGFISGEVSWMEGAVGEAALGFHGAGVAPGYVSIANRPSFNFLSSQSFSISAWVNPANMPSKWAAWVVHSSEIGGYGFWSSPQNQWVFGTSTGTINLVGGNLAPGWHHIVGVQDATFKTRSLYVDGALVATGISGDASASGELWIGGAPNNDDAFVDGTIDDVRIYGRALLPAEVNALSQWCNPSKPTDLSASIRSSGITLHWSYAGRPGPLFRIERSLDGANWSDLATMRGSAMSFVDTSASMAKNSCRYRLCAIGESGPSEYSNVAQINLPATTAMLPSASAGNPRESAKNAQTR